MVAQSSSFVLPPTNGSLPLNNLVDFHLANNSDKTWVVLSASETTPEVSVTYQQLAHTVHRVAHNINPNGSIPQGSKVAILASTDTIVYLTIILGVLRAGLIPFPISPRTQLEGITHLITSTKTNHAITGGSAALVDLRNNVLASLSDHNYPSLNLIAIPTLDDLYPEFGKTGSTVTQNLVPFPDVEPTTEDSPLIILHSSGSTGLPRPVSFHQKGVLANLVNQPSLWEAGNAGERVALMALPTFHTMGYVFQCIGPLFTGYVPVLFAPSPTPVIPTAELILKTMSAAKCTFMFSVPAFLETWSRDEEAVAELKKLRGIMYSGGPLSQWVGDKLVSKGVPVYALYGSTEAGCTTHSNNPEREPSDWVYVEFSKQANVQFIPQHDDEGSHELIFVDSADHKPFVLNYDWHGEPAYETKDLLVPHPTKKGLWKLVGRLDDQIILLNGEKTNPGPMEAEIRKSPVVQFAAMFGRERNQTGVLIELKPEVQEKSMNPAGRASLIDEIWPYIEKANATSPTHSRLAKSTILFAHPDRPLPRTPKGTVPRSAAIKAYKTDIEEMYASLEKDETGDVTGPAKWDDQDMVEAWLDEKVESLLGRKVDPKGDLFQQGLDSLTATLLTRTLKSALHVATESNVQHVADKVTQQTIFSKPSIQQLATYILQLSTNSSPTSPAELHKAGLATIKSMIDQHTVERPRADPVVQTPASERVVLTGTTGALGSHLLAQLLTNEKVSRVWALNRKSSGGVETTMKRQRASYEEKCLDIELLESEKLVFVESDLSVKGLGLEHEVYDEIRSSATAIIHNAWQVNFNLSLQSFESSILGAQNLIDLAFISAFRPRFLFTSSISAAGIGAPGTGLPEQHIHLEDVATGFGYGESKFVTEKMLESAQLSGLETCVVRLGQLTGDKQSGSWSPTDWVPSIVASSLSAGCLPDALGGITWIPLDIAARTIIDACLHRDSLLPPVIHCAHPSPIPWTEAMSIFANVLKARTDGKALALVPFSEWNAKVTAAAAAASSPDEAFKRFPSTKIQGTVDGMNHADEEVRKLKGNVGVEVEAGGMARMSTTNSERLSETFRTTEPLGEVHISKWVGYWETRGLFV